MATLNEPLRLHRAIGGLPLVVEIDEETPELGRATQELGYRTEASLLADALYASLPGGVIDRLLIELLERRASRLIVPL